MDPLRTTLRTPPRARRTRRPLLALLALLALAPASGVWAEGDPVLADYLAAIRFFPSNNAFPYEAVGNRKAAIEAGREALHRGMGVEAIRDLMGPPDEIHPLYDHKSKGAPPVGFSTIYFTRRLAMTGSQIERGERGVWLRFGLDGRLRAAQVHEVPGFLEVWPAPAWTSCEEARQQAATDLASGRTRLMVIGPKRYGGDSVQRFRRFLMRTHGVELMIWGCRTAPGDRCYQEAMNETLAKRFGADFLERLEREAGVRQGK